MKIEVKEQNTPAQLAYNYWALDLSGSKSIFLWQDCPHTATKRIYSGNDHWRECIVCGADCGYYEWDEYDDDYDDERGDC